MLGQGCAGSGGRHAGVVVQACFRFEPLSVYGGPQYSRVHHPLGRVSRDGAWLPVY